MRLNFKINMKSFFRYHKLLALNLFLLVCGLIAGAYFYIGKLAGQGDDLVCLNPVTWSSSWDFIRWFYMNWSPFGISIHLVPWQMVVRLFQLGPDAFPWWLPASLGLFFIIAAPLNLAMASRKLLSDKSKGLAVFMVFFLAYLWIINGAVYTTTIGVPVIFLEYNLQIYNISLALFLVAQPAFEKRWWHWPFFGLLLFCALTGPATMTFSLPILFAMWSAAKMISQRQTIKAWLRQIGFYMLFSTLAVIIVRTAPGYVKRFAAIGIKSPNFASVWNRLPMWYDQSISFGYSTLFPEKPYFHLFHNTLLSILIAGLIATGFAWWLMRKRRAFEIQGRLRSLLGLNILALGFMAAFQASFLSLLVTSYFPEYTRVYPALLLAAGLGFGFWWGMQATDINLWRRVWAAWRYLPDVDADNFPERQKLAVKLAAAALLLMIFWQFTLPHIEGLVNAYRFEIWRGKILSCVRSEIIASYLKSGRRNYRLTKYFSLPETGYEQLTPEYFKWRGYPKINTVNEGAGDTLKALGDRSWVTIDCKVPPLFPWQWNTGDYLPLPVRKTMSVTPDNVGVEEYDFWISENVTSCTVTGAYNPLIRGNHRYRGAFEYRLLFGVAYSQNFTLPTAVRVMEVYPVGHLKGIFPQTTVSIGFVDKQGRISSEVPLAAFNCPRHKQPLVRVSIANVDPAYLTAYSRVQIECKNGN